MTFSVELVGLLVYGIVLVWYASKLHSAVTSLTEAVRELKALYTAVASDLSGHGTRITVLEDFRARVESALAAAPHVAWSGGG